MTPADQSIIPITGVIKNYPWGSHVTLANHRGESTSVEPEAELWFGDNRQGPSQLTESNETLDQVTSRFGQLPFLVKILAVENSLSLQVHPSLEDIPLIREVVKDDNHKPEMLIALTEFHALVGFAAVEDSLQEISTLGSQKVSDLVGRPLLAGASYKEVLEKILGVDDSEGILDEVQELLTESKSHRARWLRELISLYAPKLDPLAILLCELMVLSPGESVYLPPRCIHAYLHGNAVEIMANSDNVVRGGLTHKPIDKRNFLALIEERVGLGEQITPVLSASEREWIPPIDDFAIRELHGQFTKTLELTNHAIAFCWTGDAMISPSGNDRSLDTGIQIRHNRGAFLAPGRYDVTGDGSIWVATGKGR